MSWDPLPIETDPGLVTDRLLDALVSRGVLTAPLDEADPLVVFAEELGYETALLRQRARDAAAAAVAGMGTTVYEVPSLPGARATLSARLTLTGAGAVAPAGLTVVGRTADAVDVAFTLPANATAGAGGTVDVTLTATDVSAVHNGVPAGPLTLVTATSTVQAVEALAASSGGVDAEAQTAYLDRLVAYLSTLRPGGVRADDLAILARSVTGVHRALGIDLFDPGRVLTDGTTTSASTTVTSATGAFTASDVGRTITGAGIPAGATITAVNSLTSVTISAAATATATAVTLTLGDLTNVARTATVVPVDVDGQPVSDTVRTALVDLLATVREVNFIVRVGTPTYTAVAVAYTAVAEPGADPAVVLADVHEAASAFLHPGRWAEGADPTDPVWEPVTSVRYLDLARVLGSVPGVAFLRDLTINGGTADVPLAGRAPLPASTTAATPTTITGTVV